ncbi:hypothetical protein DVH05_027492 [Phytophthora capsici]|nr:hypothetical protein DVH05_015299 [Phytophthora capsici]KAG1706640.1 hypothetical protein DVH05_027492 [Phytophthora capsici]
MPPKTTKIKGPCAYTCRDERCEAQEDEELVAEECSAPICRNYVHHFYSNKLLEGDLSTRVCSEACLGILTGNGPSNDPAIAPKTQNTFPRPALRRHANGNSNDASGKPTKERYKQQSTCSIALASEAARQRDVAPYKSPGYSRSAAAQFKPPIKPRTRKHPTINSTIPTRVTSGIGSETSSTKSTLDQLSTDKPSDDFDGMDVESLSSLGASSDEQNEDQDVPNHVSNVGESEHEPSNMSTSKLQKRKRRKFYFSQTADLALLKEMLAVEPYAGAHGQIGARYQRVADNLTAHLRVKPKLSERTVKERFTLLMEEFKSDGQSYRKKSGVSEQYEEHKQLLQDISDRMRDVKAQKADKKKKKKGKEDRLQTLSEILKEKAVKRRSEREAGAEESNDSTSNDREGSSAQSGTGWTGTERASTASSTSNRKERRASKSHDESLTAYLENQVLNRQEDNALQKDQLDLMKRKRDDDKDQWEREFQFRKSKHKLDEKKWNDEIELRQQEMQIRRDEINLMRLQFQALQDQISKRNAENNFSNSN